MAEDLGEKSEEATPFRRRKAREDGQVARSTDFGAALMLLLSVVTVAVGMAMLLQRGGELVVGVLDGDLLGDPTAPGESIIAVNWTAARTLRAMAPVLGFIFLAAIVSQLVQVGFLFAPKGIAPSLGKLNPLKGFTRIFGAQGLVKALLDITKISVVGLVASLTLMQYEPRIATLPQSSLPGILAEIARLLIDFTIRLLVVLLLIGILDLVWQRIKLSRDLRMTKQQITQETKDQDGDPKIKQRRMQIARQIAMQRIGAAVPKADVIVTNPTHYSVAIRYDEGDMAAPVVVAKGVDSLALRIRQLAAQHDIPVVERPPLARGLYADVEVGHPIPQEFYSAVAEVLAYVYQLAGRAVPAA
ncbi:MAG: flagellar biosynthesis protein FlhB [Phycisphaerales bacterium]